MNVKPQIIRFMTAGCCLKVPRIFQNWFSRIKDFKKEKLWSNRFALTSWCDDAGAETKVTSNSSLSWYLSYFGDEIDRLYTGREEWRGADLFDSIYFKADLLLWPADGDWRRVKSPMKTLMLRARCSFRKGWIPTLGEAKDIMANAARYVRSSPRCLMETMPPS